MEHIISKSGINSNCAKYCIISTSIFTTTSSSSILHYTSVVAAAATATTVAATTTATTTTTTTASTSISTCTPATPGCTFQWPVGSDYAWRFTIRSTSCPVYLLLSDQLRTSYIGRYCLSTQSHWYISVCCAAAINNCPCTSQQSPVNCQITRPVSRVVL